MNPVATLSAETLPVTAAVGAVVELEHVARVAVTSPAKSLIAPPTSGALAMICPEPYCETSMEGAEPASSAFPKRLALSVTVLVAVGLAGTPRPKRSSYVIRNGWVRIGWRRNAAPDAGRTGPARVPCVMLTLKNPELETVVARAGCVCGSASIHNCPPPSTNRRSFSLSAGEIGRAVPSEYWLPRGRYRTSYWASWAADVSERGTSQ